MREFARRVALQRRFGLVGKGGLATLATLAALGAPSAMAAGSVGITTSYEQTPISVGASDAIGFAITNTTSATVSNLTFTDVLPTGVTLDDPIGLTNTAGSNGSCGTVTATNPNTGNPSVPGDIAVTITIASVPNVAKTVCTISLGIITGTASVSDAPYKDTLTSTTTTPTPTLTPAGLVVLANPTITLTRPTNGLKLRFGQIYDSSFSCAATDPLDTVNSVFADDGDGNQINSGQPIDSVDAGPNSFEVDCASGVGGGQFTQTVNYTVKSFALKSVQADPANGAVSFAAALPAGKGVAELLDGKKILGKTSFRLRHGKTAKVSVTPSAAGAGLLSAAGAAGLRAKLEVSYTPQAVGAGDSAILPQGPTIVTRSVKLSAS